jgi:adenine-specific DNA-methyltransferase
MNKTTEELQQEIDELKLQVAHLKSCKRYGLEWENKEEEFDHLTKNAFPILTGKNDTSYPNISVKDSNKKNPHILIEGDNYHSLSVLSYTHKGKIDVIYIDPPYNTGNKSWKYNNDYVEKDDSYLHSKWLSMMNKRLLLAKELLSPDGCLVCAIDENEMSNLDLLLKEMFSGYKVDHVVIVHNPRGVQGNNFSYVHEYALFVYPKGKKSYIGDVKRDEPLVEELRDHGGSSLRTDAKSCFYPFIVKGDKIIGIGEVPPNDFHPSGKNVYRSNGSIEIYPIDRNGTERKWVFANNTVHKILSKLHVEKRNDGLFDIYRTKDMQKPRTVWSGKKYDASTWGSKVVKEITGVDFPYPKSIYTVFDAISILARDNKKSIVLDFFSGSGTTGHAVMDLNKEDGGNRQFILCTNNENNICEEVTYERVKRVMQGYTTKKGKKIAGLGGELIYLKTDFVKKQNNETVTDEDKIKLTYEVGSVLALKENTFNKVKESTYYQIFSSSKQLTGIYFNENKIDLSELVEYLANQDKPCKLYLFSWTKGEYKHEFSEYENITTEDIPEPILDIYKSIGVI